MVVKEKAEKRIIAHLDMDAFFAAVEERDNPRIQGKPIVVGSDPKDGQGRGVVSTANYKARQYGIRSALPITKAWQISREAANKGLPEVVFLPVNYKKYGNESERIMEIIKKYSFKIEQASIDEAYFDLTGYKKFKSAAITAEKIKKEIKEKTKLTASIGVGPNKLIAKIASDYKKPDGLTVVLPQDAEKFIEPMGVRVIPGIGPKTESRFIKINVRFIHELKKIKQAELESLFGKWGKDIYGKARGRDDSPLIEEWKIKSIGEQETFMTDTDDFGLVSGKMRELSGHVFRRFSKSGFSRFKTVAITVRFSDFTTKNRARTLDEPSSSLRDLEFESLRLLIPFFDLRENKKHKKIRLIGIRLEKLTSSR